MNRSFVVALFVASVSVGCGGNGSGNPPVDSGSGTDNRVEEDSGGGGTDAADAVVADAGTVDVMDAAEVDCTICVLTDACLTSLIEGGISNHAASCNGLSGSSRATEAAVCQGLYNQAGCGTRG